jgi:hypothetical protein
MWRSFGFCAAAVALVNRKSAMHAKKRQVADD